MGEIEEEEEDSWPITTMEHLSRVSLRPTFTGTMSLRSFLFSAPVFLLSTSKWWPSKIVVMELHSSGVAMSFAFLLIYLRSWTGKATSRALLSSIDPRWCCRGSKWSTIVVHALNEKNGYHVEYIIFVNVFTSSFSSSSSSYKNIL